MAHENIEFTHNNFCIGPQAGTYCFVNYTDLNNVLLQVKNSSGALIRNYAFLPNDIFYTNQSAYPHNVIVDLKYVGPKGRAGFFTEATFYTMERVIMGNVKLGDGSSREYSDRCVIRKWSVDNDAFTLVLKNTFYINSDDTYYFDSHTFSIQVQELTFSSSTSAHTEEIDISDTSGLTVGDVLQLGPSSDADNPNNVEDVYIHAINGNTVEIRSFDGINPTRYEYIVGDPITFIGDIFLISNPRPIFENNPGQIIDYGDSSDGDVNITTSDTIINSYTYITSNVSPATLNYVVVADSNIFSVGQEVLIHQTQDYLNNNTGVFEFKTITAINSNILIFNSNLQHSYYSGSFNALQSLVAQVVSVPNYNNLTVETGTGIIAKNWDGYSGGIVVFRTYFTLNFAEGSEGISADNTGFRGGGDNGGLDGSPGDPGEGYKGFGWLNNSEESNCLANGNGGGGGYGPSGYSGTAGGGGGNRTKGGNAFDNHPVPATAIGGAIVGDYIPNTIFLGGGGGGGGDDDNHTSGVCRGGNGGGIIIIKGRSIVDLNASANGEKGTDNTNAAAGCGGGGAGGVIFVEAATYFESNVICNGGPAGIDQGGAIAGEGGLGYKITPTTMSDLIFAGYADNGNVFRLDQTDYGNVIDYNENAKYTNVQASVWNISTGGLSFVKVNNYMTVDVEDGYENIKSQVIKNITKDFEEIYVYALDYYGNDLYFLQEKVIKAADDGTETIISWQTYNYVKDSIIPYNFSTNIKSPKDLLVKYTQIVVEVTVRDQFNVGVLGSNVTFSYIGDPSAVLDPLSGYVITDSNGICTLTFTTAASYTGPIQFRARSDKGSTNQGSEYTNGYYNVEEYVEFTNTQSIITQLEPEFKSSMYIQQITTLDSELYLTCLAKYRFGIGSWDPSKSREIECALVQQIIVPALSNVDIFVSQTKPFGDFYLSQVTEKEDTLQLSQMTSSRHISNLNKDSVNINQYTFIQDTIPPFWEEKVTVNTYIWVRLRPFAYSLDPTTLIFLVKEVNTSINYNSGFKDVTTLGEITLYDAGGGMFGVDFLYQPSTFFTNESTIFIDITIQDTAPTPNTVKFDYWFKIISDYRGPVVYNVSPPKNSIGIPLDTVVGFYITDPGIGLDVEDIEVFINDSKVDFNYEFLEKNTYKITYDITDLFNYGSTISVNIAATDMSKFKNTTYEFWTLTFIDSTGPMIDMSNAEPHMCERGVSVRLSDISFQIYAIDGTGIDIDTINTSIGGKDFNSGVSLLPVIYHLRKP